MQKRGQVQCVRLLESRAKRGGVGGHFSGCVGQREGCFCAAGSVWLFFFAESDRIWQRSLVLPV